MNCNFCGDTGFNEWAKNTFTRPELSFEVVWNAAIAAAIEQIKNADDGGKECQCGINLAIESVERIYT